KLSSGRPAAAGFVNLFTGLVHYPAHVDLQKEGDRCTMVLLTKPTRQHLYRYLASYKGFRGKADTAAVPYAHAEHVLLKWLKEVKPSDFAPGKQTGDEDLLAIEHQFLTDRIRDLCDSLEQVGTPVAAVVQKIASLEARKTEVASELTRRRRQAPPP